MARSLGRRGLTVLFRVTVRLAWPGLVAAFCLVFLSAVTELTATLLLIPTGAQTLATQFWSYESNLSYSQAAPFALVMIVVAAVPSYLAGPVLQPSGDGGMRHVTVTGLHKAFGPTRSWPAWTWRCRPGP